MKLSICIPTYNRLHDLKMCLQSVFAARAALDGGDEIEVLVSNNASEDGTSEYIYHLENDSKKLNFLGWTNEDNIGALNNIKKVMKKASGEYIFCLTDDDLLLPNALLVLKKYVEDDRYSFLKTANTTYLTKSKKCYYYGVNRFISDDTDRGNFLEIMKFTHIFSGCVVKNSELLHRKLIDSENVYPSIEMCALNAGHCGFISEPIVFHQWENEIFWEKDVDMSSEQKRMAHLSRDAQLALLHLRDGFLNDDQISELYSYFLSKYGYVEKALIEKFRVSATKEIASHLRDTRRNRMASWLRSNPLKLLKLIRTYPTAT